MLQALELDTGSDEAAVPGLNRDNAYEREVLLPDLETQEATASFLDFEVQAVDTLIEAKQRRCWACWPKSGGRWWQRRSCAGWTAPPLAPLRHRLARRHSGALGGLKPEAAGSLRWFRS